MYYLHRTMKTLKPEKLRKSYRINPLLCEFMSRYSKSKRWTETTTLEYALELLAEKEGYKLDFDNQKIA